jgi:uncharacterized protein (TIGR02145 family)
MKVRNYFFLLCCNFLACQAQFKTIKIGEQVWMAENLNVATFCNGDTIPEAKTQQEWDNACFNEQPAWCYYNNDPKNGIQHGKLYNWYAFIDSRGLAPDGFSIPSDLEWRVLADFLSEGSGPSDKMRSKTGWLHDGNGSNSSGFNAFPSGARSGGSFNDLGTTCAYLCAL